MYICIKRDFRSNSLIMEKKLFIILNKNGRGKKAKTFRCGRRKGKVLMVF